MTGGVLSIFTVTGAELERPAPFVAEHVTLTPAVSALRVAGPQPVEDAMPESGSVTIHVIETVPRTSRCYPDCR
jgi:hypothetical protein